MPNKILADALSRTSIFQDASLIQDSSQALAFLTGQLESVETQIYQKKRALLDYEALLPISTSAGQWATSITYRMKDFAGQGQRHSGKGDDIPRVDVHYDTKSIPVISGSIGYAYTFNELRMSAKLNLAIDQDRAEAAFYAYRAHLNQVGLFGEKELTGLFNSPFVPQVQAGVGSWTTATPEQVLKELNEVITQVWTQTKRNSTPNTIILPGAHYAHLASTP
ncbi:major capsid family protein, partial [Mycoavidus cysteinexigens]